MIRKAVFLATAAAISVMCINAKAAENVCAKPEIAKIIMNEFNYVEEGNKVKVIDIEHVVTIDGNNGMHSCHGTWDLEDGRSVEGTITFRNNIAGDPIVSFRTENLGEALLRYHTSDTIETNRSQSSGSYQPESFSDGAHDRAAWERWFNGLSVEERAGAYYWSAERSKSHPGSCEQLGGKWEIGCLEAKERLTPTDVRRKADPLYKAGWNSIQSNS